MLQAQVQGTREQKPLGQLQGALLLGPAWQWDLGTSARGHRLRLCPPHPNPVHQHCWGRLSATGPRMALERPARAGLGHRGNPGQAALLCRGLQALSVPVRLPTSCRDLCLLPADGPGRSQRTWEGHWWLSGCQAGFVCPVTWGGPGSSFLPMLARRPARSVSSAPFLPTTNLPASLAHAAGETAPYRQHPQTTILAPATLPT